MMGSRMSDVKDLTKLVKEVAMLYQEKKLSVVFLVFFTISGVEVLGILVSIKN